MEKDVKKDLIPIGKMAKATHISVAALRLYDEMGLLTPAFTDAKSGYRYYDIRQTPRLEFIRNMHDIGTSVKQQDFETGTFELHPIC